MWWNWYKAFQRIKSIQKLEYWCDIKVFYPNINDCNPDKNFKILIGFDDVIPDLLIKKF